MRIGNYKKNSNKVVLIGAGAVGTTFIYSAINQGIASDYVLIDAFPNATAGNVTVDGVIITQLGTKVDTHSIIKIRNIWNKIKRKKCFLERITIYVH